MDIGVEAGEYLRTLAGARAATADGEWDRAIALWEWVVRQNPVDGGLWAKLGDARYHAGNFATAVPAYERAQELGVMAYLHSTDEGTGFPFDIAYRVACCHLEMGDPEQAITWLQQAFAKGYRDLEQAQQDDRLEALRDDPRFRKLVGLVDTGTLSRDEGWRYDLALLARETKRRSPQPFRHVTEAEFDAEVQRIHDAIPTLTDLQITIKLVKLLGLLGDGHATLRGTGDHPAVFRTIPLQFYLFEEGLFVISAAPEHVDLLGAEVLRFGDRTVEDVFEAVTPLVWRDNEHWLKTWLPYQVREIPLLHALDLVPEAEHVELTVRRDGDVQTVTVAADDTMPTRKLYNQFPWPAGWSFFAETLPAPLARYLKNTASNYWFEHLESEGLIYLQFNRVADDPAESLADFTRRFFQYVDEHDIAKLVIDLRWNNGGNTFLEMPLLHGLIGSRLNQRGQLFAIIGRRTFSAAQNFCTMLEKHSNVIFVGEPTGSSPNFIGENFGFELPYSKLQVNVSDLFWQSSWPVDHRTWIPPLLYTPPTFAAYKQNRDLALEAIISLTEHLPGV